MLCIGFIKPEDEKLLIAGEAQDFIELSKKLVKQSPFSIKNGENVKIYGIDELVIEFTNSNGSMDFRDRKIVWTITHSEQKNFVNQLNELIKNEQPGHAYLDQEGPPFSKIEVIASYNEYDASIFDDKSKNLN